MRSTVAVLYYAALPQQVHSKFGAESSLLYYLYFLPQQHKGALTPIAKNTHSTNHLAA
jgi:hypothetical protein